MSNNVVSPDIKIPTNQISILTNRTVTDKLIEKFSLKDFVTLTKFEESLSDDEDGSPNSVSDSESESESD